MWTSTVEQYMKQRKPHPHFVEHARAEKKSAIGARLYDIILGGQDGVVNVLGIVLGVARATHDTRIVLISGLAATFAESISMGAVAYTSSKAARDYYFSERAREEREIETVPAIERQEIHDIYRRKGFNGTLLTAIVKKITSDKKLWLETMMTEELNLTLENHTSPLKDGILVGFVSLIGSFVPLVPFFFFTVTTSMYAALAVSLAILFLVGAIKARLTIGTWWKSGIEMGIIGMAAALAGYGIGILLGVTPLG